MSEDWDDWVGKIALIVGYIEGMQQGITHQEECDKDQLLDALEVLKKKVQGLCEND